MRLLVFVLAAATVLSAQTARTYVARLSPVPITADQPENAARCAALGLGRVIEPTDLTPERARDAVLGVLNDSSYRRNAERLRDEIAALPGPEYAVALLERLAVEKQPLLTA